MHNDDDIEYDDDDDDNNEKVGRRMRCGEESDHDTVCERSGELCFSSERCVWRAAKLGVLGPLSG